jgi:hypothetical protein
MATLRLIFAATVRLVAKAYRDASDDPIERYCPPGGGAYDR